MSAEQEQTPVLKPVEPPLAPLPDSGGGIRLIHLMILVALAAFGCWLLLLSGLWLLGGFILFPILPLVIMAFGTPYLLQSFGWCERETLLGVLKISSERSQSLASAVMAMSNEFGPFFRKRIRLLASMLKEGISLPVALDRLRGLLPRDARLMVAIGWDTGTLTTALHEAIRSGRSRDVNWGGLAFRFFYLGWVLIWLQVTAAFIMYFISPKFEAIFNDFGIPLPQMTIHVIEVTHFLIRYAIITLLLLGLEFLAFLLMALGFFQVFRLDLPLFDSLFRRRHSALIMRSLSLVVGGRQSISRGLELMIRAYPSTWVKRRLVLVSNEVRNGGSWIDALVRFGLIRRAEAGVLASAERLGNLEWALREMADSSDRRIGYRLRVLLQLLFPFVLLAVGALVFIFCVAYFSPLVLLIERLAG